LERNTKFIVPKKKEQKKERSEALEAQKLEREDEGKLRWHLG
jgi:hypothetical protein